MSDIPRDPALEHVLDAFGDAILSGVRVGLPGVITAYDATKQFCSARPLVMDRHLDEDQKKVAKEIGEVHTAPVFFLGNARARLTFPIKVGDLCYIMFASSSITRWFKIGGTKPVDPGDDRRHDVNDAIVFVGLHSQASVPTTAPVDAAVFHVDDDTKLKLGGPTGTEPTIKAETWEDKMDDVIDAIVDGITSAGGSGATVASKWLSLKGSAYKTTKTEVK